MSRPKVLLVLHDLTRTGAPKLALDLFEAFGDAYDVRVAAVRGGTLHGRAVALGPTVVLDGDGTSGGDARRLVRRLVRKARLWRLRRWRPDLVYVNSVVPVWTVPILVATPDRVPIVVHVHELDGHVDVAVEHHAEWLLRRPARYIVVSAPVRDAMVARGVDPARVSLVHAFVPAAIADRRPPVSAPGPFVVGGSGIVYWRKGVTLWLQAAAAVRRLRPELDVRFVWVGRADSRSVEIRARQLGIADIVEVVGEVSDPLAHYERFDAMFMSSWLDPCALVVFEAMALGKPVVCFAGGGGGPEQVGETGVVVDGFRPDGAAEALVALAEDPVRRARLGAAARERVRERFTDRVQVPKIRAEIDAVLGLARRGT